MIALIPHLAIELIKFITCVFLFFVGWVGEVTCQSGVAAEHFTIWDSADFAIGIDGVRADEELLGLLVDHAVGWCAADGFGSNNLFELRGDLVEFVG